MKLLMLLFYGIFLSSSTNKLKKYSFSIGYCLDKMLFNSSKLCSLTKVGMWRIIAIKLNYCFKLEGIKFYKNILQTDVCLSSPGIVCWLYTVVCSIIGVYQDVTRLARQQNVKVSNVCDQSEMNCTMNRCKNGGLCVTGWRKLSCNCYQTSYTGAHCTQGRNCLTFDFCL